MATTSLKRRGVETKAEEEAAQTSSGCMCAFFHLFDFHPFHFSIQHQQPPLNSASFVPQHHTVPKGAEAPRNSLEILEDDNGTNTMPCISKDENLKIPKSIQFIKTSGSSRSGRIGTVNDLSPAGTKTPTLVARLMGLDLLPDAQSPSSSSSSSSSASSSSYSCLSTPNPHHLKPRQYIKTKPRHSTEHSENSGIIANNIAASRSLPETPRISSARRSDVEHHRLSLQINKENMGVGEEELELPRFSFSKRKLEEQRKSSTSSSSRSPSQYARQIVKQVKESVSRRKAGTDITNTITTVIKHRESEKASGGDEFVAQFRSKKSARTTPSVSKAMVDEELPSSSPRLRFIDPKKIKLTNKTEDQNSQLSKALTKPKPKPKQDQVQVQQLPKCKKAANEKFSTPRFKIKNMKPLHTPDSIRNKQEESFVRSQYSPSRPNDMKSKSKRSHHPLVSSNLVNLNTVPSLPSTKIPQKQSQVCDEEEPKCRSQLSSGSRQRYKHEATSLRHGDRESNVQDKSNGAGSIATRADDGAEFQYVTDILSRTGLLVKDTVTPSFQFHQWISPTPTHLLNPSIFHHLEQHSYAATTNNPLGLRCKRRLLFDLVNEIVLEIVNLGPSMEGKEDGGSQLAERVWERIRRFPSAKCEVLEDIDALIEVEETMGGKRKKVVMEEEGKAMVAEIEGNIVDTLVHETVMELECCWSWSRKRSGGSRMEKTASFEWEHGGDIT